MSIREELKSQGYRTYENDEITVFWNPRICQHAAKCVQGSAEVFDPQRRPWIDLSKASAKEIAAIIDNCPSKALRYELKEQIEIVFEPDCKRSAAYDGAQKIGECEFSVSDKIWIISHTGVRPAYEGKGIAKKLVLKVIEEARKNEAKIMPLCPYANRMMTGKEEYVDVIYK